MGREPHPSGWDTTTPIGATAGARPPDQLHEQLRVIGHTLQPLRRDRDAVQIRAEADVRRAGHLHDVVDVIGDVLHGRARRGIRRFPLRERGLHLLRLAAIERLEPRFFRIFRRVASARLLRDERRHPRDHHDAIVLFHAAQHVIGNVARVIDERPRAGIPDTRDPADCPAHRWLRRRHCRAHYREIPDRELASARGRRGISGVCRRRHPSARRRRNSAVGSGWPPWGTG